MLERSLRRKHNGKEDEYKARRRIGQEKQAKRHRIERLRLRRFERHLAEDGAAGEVPGNSMQTAAHSPLFANTALYHLENPAYVRAAVFASDHIYGDQRCSQYGNLKAI